MIVPVSPAPTPPPPPSERQFCTSSPTPALLRRCEQRLTRLALPGPSSLTVKLVPCPISRPSSKKDSESTPPVVGLMSKEVPQGGDTFKGHYLPERTKIGYCAWGICRRRDVWGYDLDEFRPERWLEGPQDKLRLMEGTLELVFGYGRWQCLGKNIALMELNKVFVEVRMMPKTQDTDPYLHSLC